MQGQEPEDFVNSNWEPRPPLLKEKDDVDLYRRLIYEVATQALEQSWENLVVEDLEYFPAEVFPLRQGEILSGEALTNLLSKLSWSVDSAFAGASAHTSIRIC